VTSSQPTHATPPGWTDRRVELIIGHLLRIGVTIAALVVLTGAAIYLAHQGGRTVDYRVFRGEPNDLRGVSGIWRDAVSREGRGIIQLGLLLLIATPVARVAFSIFGFAEERDWLYVGVTAIVLAILIYSLTGSG
jgi:uncharacterized membrane protein